MKDHYSVKHGTFVIFQTTRRTVHVEIYLEKKRYRLMQGISKRMPNLDDRARRYTSTAFPNLVVQYLEKRQTRKF